MCVCGGGGVLYRSGVQTLGVLDIVIILTMETISERCIYICWSSSNYTLNMCSLSSTEYTFVKLKIPPWSKENKNLRKDSGRVQSTPEKAVKREPQLDESRQLLMTTWDFSSVPLNAWRQRSHRVWTGKRVMSQESFTASSCLWHVKMTTEKDHSGPFAWKNCITTRSRWVEI